MHISAISTNPDTNEKEFSFAVGLQHSRLEDPSIIDTDDGGRSITFVVKDDINLGEINVSLKLSDDIYNYYNGNPVEIMKHMASTNVSFQYELEKLKVDLSKMLDSSDVAGKIKNVQETYVDDLNKQHKEFTDTVEDNHREVVDLMLINSKSNEAVFTEESNRVIENIEKKSSEVVQFTSEQSESIKDHIANVMSSSRDVLKDAMEKTTDVSYLTDILVSEMTNNLNRQLYKQHKEMVEHSANTIEEAASSSLARTTELETVVSAQMEQAQKLNHLVNTMVEKVDAVVTRLDKTTEDLDRVNVLIEKLEGALDD